MKQVLPRIFLLIFIVLVFLAAFGSSSRALAPVDLTVTIIRVKEISCDEGALVPCPDDYYARVNIANLGWQDSSGQHQDQVADVSPYWTFTRPLDTSLGSVPVDIQIWDHDSTSGDDLIDISDGDDTLHLTVDLSDGSWSSSELPADNVGFTAGTDSGSALVLFDISLSMDGDTDDDGIPDGVEIYGIRDTNGNLVADMAALGADPCRKTIAVEIDYMDGAADGHTHEPKQAALNEVVATFDGAPVAAVTNCPYAGFPTQNTGINFIYDVDDALTEQATLTWGAGGEAVRNSNFDSARRPYFHYTLWVHDRETDNSSSGVCCSDSGKDVIVSLGSWFNKEGTVRDQSGTLIHELGHAFGFGHGGGDGTNCKPNYLSVMSYSLQVTGIPDPTLPANNVDLDSDGVMESRLRLDYSGSALNTLNEGALNEAAGISDGTDLATWSPDAGTTWLVSAGNMAIDWDNDGAIDPGTVNVDINNFGFGGCGEDNDGNSTPSPGEMLVGFDDWANLKFRAAMSPDAGFSPPPSGPELNFATAQLIRQEMIILANTTDLAITKTASPTPPMNFISRPEFFYRTYLPIVDMGSSVRASLLAPVPPGAAVAGTELDYAIEVTNNGPNHAEMTQVVDTLPAGVSHVSDDAGCVEAPAGTLTCDLGGLAPSDSETINLTVLIDADLVYVNGGPVTITNTATAENVGWPDIDVSDNEANVDTLVVAGADLEIVSYEAISPPAQVMVGEPFTVTLRKVIDNNGPSAPMDVSLTTTSTVPLDATISPTMTHSVELALALDEERALFENYVVTCEGYSHHLFNFSTSIEPLNAEDAELDPSNNTAEVTLDIECVVPINIDVRPMMINLNGEGVTPVLAYDNEAGEDGLPLAFDASTIDPLSVRFGPYDLVWTDAGGAAEAHEMGHGHGQGLMLHFRYDETGLMPGDTEACLKGTWYDSIGDPHTFFGCDAVKVRE